MGVYLELSTENIRKLLLSNEGFVRKIYNDDADRKGEGTYVIRDGELICHFVGIIPLTGDPFEEERVCAPAEKKRFLRWFESGLHIPEDIVWLVAEGNACESGFEEARFLQDDKQLDVQEVLRNNEGLTLKENRVFAQYRGIVERKDIIYTIRNEKLYSLTDCCSRDGSHEQYFNQADEVEQRVFFFRHYKELVTN